MKLKKKIKQHLKKSSPKDEATKFEDARKQVDEVIDIMHDNVQQIIKRGDNLEILNQKAENIESGSARFKKTAIKLERKHWKTNLKVWIVLVITCVALIGISAGLIYFIVL